MAKVAPATSNPKTRKTRPATTPEARENQFLHNDMFYILYFRFHYVV